MYAYAQKGVSDVKIEVDNKSEENKGVTVNYFIKLTPKALLKWKALKAAEKIKNPIIRKASILALAKAGAPMAIAETIKTHAIEYLPPNSKVEVLIDE
jgi:hypothetical protein